MTDPVHQSYLYRIRILTAVGISGLIFTSCVSSTLKTKQPIANTQLSQFSQSEDEMLSQWLREQAIAEIHAKADLVPEVKEAPDYGTTRKGAAKLLTPAEIIAKTKKIRAISNQSQYQTSDAELLEKQKKIKELQRKGSKHYEIAMKKLEKK